MRKVFHFLVISLIAIGIAYLLRAAQVPAQHQYVAAVIAKGELKVTVAASGTLNAVTTVKVASQLSGQVAELFADFNNEVAKDQPIAALDARTHVARVQEANAALEVAAAKVNLAEATLQRTQAALTNAQAMHAVEGARVRGARSSLAGLERELQRRRVLGSLDFVSRRDLDQTQTLRDTADAELQAAGARETAFTASVDMAQADMHIAEANLQDARAQVLQRKAALDAAEVEFQRTLIRSPIDGIIIGRSVDKGQTVAAALEAETLFTIAQNLREMAVHVKIDEADIGRLRLGQSATFTMAAYPGQSFTGTVTQIRKAHEVVQNVVTYVVVISAPNPDLMLFPGMTATTQIVVDDMHDVLLVPNAALRFRPPSIERTAVGTIPPRQTQSDADQRKGVVWRLDAGDALPPVAVTVGATDGNTSQLTSGELTPGQRVAVSMSDTSRASRLSGLRFGW